MPSIIETPVAMAPLDNMKVAEPKPWRETPLIESSILSQQAGCRIFLKLEHLQPSGSFKSRAIGNLVLSHILSPTNANKTLHFFIPSGGNAGLAATLAARSYGYPCTVAIPTTIKPLMANQLRAAGARVVPHGQTIDEAAAYMRAVLMEETRQRCGDEVAVIELHPFDREAIWEGVSTLVDELARQLPGGDGVERYEQATIPCDAIACSVGGGGLMNGIIRGLERQRKKKQQQQTQRTGRRTAARRDIHIIAAETIGSDSLAQSIAKREAITLPRITSIASSLGVVKVAEKTLQNALTPPVGVAVHPVVLHDSEAARGALRLVDAERILVETACGVAVEAVLGPGKGRDAVVGVGSRVMERSPCSYKFKESSDDASSYDSDCSSNDSSSSSSSIGNDSGLSTPASEIEITGDNADIDDECSTALPPPVTGGVSNRLAQLIPDFNPETRVVIVVCGGTNVSVDMAAEWRKMLAEGWGREEC